MRTIASFLVVSLLPPLLLPGEAIAKKLQKEELTKFHLKAIGENPARKGQPVRPRGALGTSRSTATPLDTRSLWRRDLMTSKRWTG